MNYDPNLTNSGRMATQCVKLIFAEWDYRAEVTVKVGGNCRGLSVIKAAVSNAFDALKFDEYEGKEYSEITLKKPNGDELRVVDEELNGEGWLEDMLIAAEIISIEPQEGK